MIKRHKILTEFVALKETEHWAIDLMISVKFMQDIAKIATKYWFGAYAKGYPKDVLEYVPTGKRIIIKTVEDIADLTPEQFDIFIEDLRVWTVHQRWLNIIKKFVEVRSETGMIWIDNWEHKTTIKASVEISDKM
jgi:uncharacterized alkaline shock family protein YloU